MKKRDYYDVLGVARGRFRSRHQKGLPAARPQAPPGRQSRRQDRAEAVSGGPGGLRRPQGRREAASLRAVRSRGVRARIRPRRGGVGRFRGRRRRRAVLERVLSNRPTSPTFSETSSAARAGSGPSPRRESPPTARSRWISARPSWEAPRHSRFGGRKRVPRAAAPVRWGRTSVRRAAAPGGSPETERVRIRIPEGTERRRHDPHPRKGGRRPARGRVGRPVRHGACAAATPTSSASETTSMESSRSPSRRLTSARKSTCRRSTER